VCLYVFCCFTVVDPCIICSLFISLFISAYISLPSKSFQIVSQTASNSAFGGGSLIAGGVETTHGKWMILRQMWFESLALLLFKKFFFKSVLMCDNCDLSVIFFNSLCHINIEVTLTMINAYWMDLSIL
jgi:hypothetical protein